MAAPSPQFQLHPVLEQAFTAGRAHYGDLGLDFRSFAGRLALIVDKHVVAGASVTATTAFLNRLHTADLYLTCACAERSRAGWECFLTRYWKYIFDLASFFAPYRDLAGDLAGDVIVDLYLPDGSGHSRIASYDGLRSLARWLRVIVGHRAADAHRRKANHMEPLERNLDQADQDATGRIEAAVRAHRYGPLIREAFTAAAHRLTAAERLVVLLRYEEELQINEIARLRGVHASSVTRQVARVLKKLRREVLAALRSRHGLTEAALEECLAEVLENPAHSLFALLKQP